MGLVKTYVHSIVRVITLNLTPLHSLDIINSSVRVSVLVSPRPASPPEYTTCASLQLHPSSRIVSLTSTPQAVAVVSAPHALMALWTILLRFRVCRSIFRFACLRHLIHVGDRRLAWLVVDICKIYLLLGRLSLPDEQLYRS